MFDRMKKFFGQYVYWYCDNCGYLMNDQKGFNDKNGVWECQNCGFVNDVTKNNMGDNQVKKQYNEEVKAYFDEFERIPFKYNSVITEKVLADFAVEASQGIERLEEIYVDKCRVCGTIRTISGLDSWQFEIDFNYYGEITGDYKHLYSENGQSNIPYGIAKRIKKMILDAYAQSGTLPPNPEIPQTGKDYSCGQCDAWLNTQYGYNDDCMFWKCKGCGQMNKLPFHYVRDRKIDNVDKDGHEIYIPH